MTYGDDGWGKSNILERSLVLDTFWGKAKKGVCIHTFSLSKGDDPQYSLYPWRISRIWLNSHTEKHRGSSPLACEDSTNITGACPFKYQNIYHLEWGVCGGLHFICHFLSICMLFPTYLMGLHLFQ
jgi:hypothetical protein